MPAAMSQQHVSVEMDKMLSTQGDEGSTSLNQANIDTIDGRIARRAVPETDDDDDELDERPTSTDRRHGVDDGFLPSDDRGASKPPNGTRARWPSYGGWDQSDDPGFVEINGVRTPVPDVNAYQHKKTLAQGMMDLALLSANANQLRYVLETYRRHPYFYPSLIFISLSIVFQIAVGVGLIWNSRYNIKNKKEICRANRINNYTIIGIFIVTVVNVFISAFGVADPADAA